MTPILPILTAPSSGPQLVDMLGMITTKPAVGSEAELGAGIAGGELPHAQACVLYVLRTSVVEQLSETGQRLLLEKCALLCQAPTKLAPQTARRNNIASRFEIA